MGNLKAGFAIFFLTMATHSWAEEPQPVYIMEEVDVYGQRVGISNKQLSPEEIRDIQNSGEIGRSIDHESGLETQGEGKGKSWSALAIRGQSFRETVVLVNGQRVPESFNLGTIPTENIERVEILEGPQALAYGSDALGGVINIITRKAADNPFRFQFSGGDFNTYQLQGSLPSFNVSGVENVLSGSWFTTDGYLAPVTAENGTVYGFTDEVHWDFSHAASWKMGEDKADLLTSFFRHIGSAPDADNVIAAGTDQYDLDGRQDAWGIQSTFKDSHSLGGNWVLTPSLFGNYSDVLRSNPLGADPTSGVYHPYRSQYLNYGGQIYATSSGGGVLSQLSIGLEGREEELWSDLYDSRSRNVFSLAISGTLKFTDSFRLDLSNRLDDTSDFSVTDNPVGTFIVEAAPGWKLHLSLGKGSKVPTFDQLYLPYTSFTALPPDLQIQVINSPFAFLWGGDKGNPGLQPEQSYDAELGTDIAAGVFLVQLSGFVNYYQNLINPTVDPADNFWTYINIDHALFAGTEDSVKLKLVDWCSPTTSLTWISATDDGGNPIPGRLRFKFTAGMDLKPEKEWSLDVDARYVDRNPVATQYAFDLFLNNGIPVAPTGYWSLETGIKYTISEHLKGFINVENILNEQMASFQGIPLAGRTFEAGLQAQF